MLALRMGLKKALRLAYPTSSQKVSLIVLFVGLNVFKSEITIY